MKTSLLSIVLLITTLCRAQTSNLQVGAVTTFLRRDEFGEREHAFGGEFAANIPIQKNMSLGPAIQLLKFNTEDNLYTPVFATFKLNVPQTHLVYFFHVDAGYGIHNFKSSFTDTADNDVSKLDFENTGGLYLATGAGIKLKGKFAPYINVQYSLYRFKFVTKDTDINEAKEYVYEQHNTARGITVTAGIYLAKKK